MGRIKDFLVSIAFRIGAVLYLALFFVLCCWAFLIGAIVMACIVMFTLILPVLWIGEKLGLWQAFP